MDRCTLYRRSLDQSVLSGLSGVAALGSRIGNSKIGELPPVSTTKYSKKLWDETARTHTIFKTHPTKALREPTQTWS